jgi:Tfp pilus assembly protein PilF
MSRLSLLTLLVITVCTPLGSARGQIDHGATGTLNLDYFNPTNDGHLKWLINDIEKHHLKPALYHIAEGDLRRAKIELDYLLARLVNHPHGLALGGLLARTNRDSLWGIANFERALKVYPEYAITHAQYGKFLADLGQVDASIQKLKKALEMDPQLAPAYDWLAAAYLKRGDSELADEIAARAKSLSRKP